MSTIVLRSVKGTPLSNTEVDTNFSNLNTDKTELGGTYSAGTANGVLFLSSSKVLTTGSALTFDGSRLSVGAGTALNVSGYNNIVLNGSTGGLLELKSNDTRVLQIQTDGAAAGAQIATVANGSNPPLIFGVNSTEQMRLTSTGLGIGTSSPGAKLDVRGNAVIGARSGYAELALQSLLTAASARGASFRKNWDSPFDFNIYASNGASGSSAATIFYRDSVNESMRLDSSGNLGIGTSSPTRTLSVYSTSSIPAVIESSGTDSRIALFTSSGTGGQGFIQASSGSLLFGSSNAERMRLDSSGNLGLGVTPSAWDTYKSFELGQYGYISSGASWMELMMNTYYGSGAYRYKGTGQASHYLQQSGTHQWFTAPSGTAGNAISFSQVMTLNASGNLGIGTSSPLARVHAYSGTAMTQITADGTGAIKTGVNFANGGTTYGQIYFDNNSPYDMSVFQQYTTGSLRFGTNNTERMRLDSSGNLGIGTSSPAAKLGVAGAIVSQATAYTAGTGGATFGYYSSGTYPITYLQMPPSGGFQLWASDTAARLAVDTSGNLGIGTSSPGAKLQVLSAGRGTIFGSNSALNFYSAWQYNSTDVGYIGNGPSIIAAAAATDFGLTAFTGGKLWLGSNNGASYAVLDSSGNFLMGTTSSSLTSSNSIIALPGAGGFYVQHASGVTSGTIYVGFGYDGSAIGTITQSGTTAVLYNTTSDQRLKENIQDAAPASALIDALQVRQYDWKSDGSHQRYGFVAQELVNVAPEAVYQPADPEEMMAVDYSKLVPMLVKEIQSLRARVAALESI